MLKPQIDILKTELAYSYFRLRSYNKKVDLSKISAQFEKAYEEIKRDGVTVIENYYDSAHCESIRNEINRLIELYKEFIWTDKENSDHRIFGAEKYSEIINAFSQDLNIHAFGEKYLKTKLKLTMTLAARLDYQEGNLGSGGGWHRDSVIFNEFKSIIYLSDVEKDNGPFTYILGSHTQESVKKAIQQADIKYDQYRFNEEEIKQISNSLQLKSKTFTAKQGSLILVDTRGIHIGSPIQKGSRYALTNYFSPEFRYEKMMKHCNKVILKTN